MRNLFFLLLLIGYKTPAFATTEAQLLISEMESLYSELPDSDKSKLPLTYKLADLHFNQATIDKDEDIDKFKAFDSATKYYQAILSHPQFKQSAQKEVETLNINFQLGRLYHRFKEYEESIKYFSQVFHHEKSSAVLKKESALFLAELYETLAELKKAEHFYQQALLLCPDVFACSYIHFKLAWAFYRSEQLDDALASMEKTLFDKDGILQEKSVRDYLLFSAQKGDLFESSINKVTEIETKSGRKDLLEMLGHNFYAAGNRTAGTKVFSLLNQQEKKYRQQLRLLEEYYGDRDFESYDLILTQLESAPTTMPTEEVEVVESLNTFRRLIVQLDGERKTNEKATPFLKRTLTTYLKFYPMDEMREKMINGWLNANKDKAEAIDFLSRRLAEEAKDAEGLKREKEWRLKRLVIAQELLESNASGEQKTQWQKDLLEDAQILAELDKDKARKWNYVVAKTYYDQKNYEQATKLFQKLADISGARKDLDIDEYAIKAQNLMLDIYNQQKNFAAISTQVQTWTTNALFGSSKNLEIQRERESQLKLAQDAHFEHLVSQGNNAEALSQFIALCKDKKYVDKSCANAKSIAAALDDRNALLSLYELENDVERLEQEYEYLGHFAKAAALKERKLTAKSDSADFLKVAILYELEAKYPERDRVMNLLYKNLMSRKTQIPDDEAKLLLGFYESSGLMNQELLRLKWPEADRTYLLTFLHERQLLRGKEELAFYQSSKNLGADWEKNKLSGLLSAYKKQKDISFYGANSRSLFTKRVAALTKLKEGSNLFLDSASSEGQFLTLSLLERAYNEFATEIETTPLPDGLTEEELAQVREGLASLAAPFKEETENYKKLRIDLLAKLSERTRLEELTAGDVTAFLSFYSTPTKTYQISRVDENEIKSLLSNFQQNPQATASHESMMKLFENKGHAHLAVFLKGRLETMNGQTREVIK